MTIDDGRIMNEPDCHQAVALRDRSADGLFVYAVITTGVYCRPSCPSRAARPANLRFFATDEDAEKAGFRPCKRCRPDQAQDRHAASILAACRTIDAAETPPSLTDLAAAAGLSPHHFHRQFKRLTGMTPLRYARAAQAERAQAALTTGGRVTDAVYEAGFSTPSRFYDQAPRMFGMKPTHFKANGRGETVRVVIEDCSLGRVLIGATEHGVCAIDLDDDDQALRQVFEERFAQAKRIQADDEFRHWVRQVIAVVDDPTVPNTFPLDIRGTLFQRQVWQALQEIPPGETRSYGQIAAALGRPNAVRAVGSACGANNLAVVVPCHRVKRGDGQLGGYKWHLSRKKKLLAKEQE